jgi:molybdopterin molybdotransferase
VAESERQIRRALAGTDLLVTIGGASVGDHDLMRPAMEAVGVVIDFWGVAIKPGKPTAVGSHMGTKVLCLPGNPASASVMFMLFGVAMLRAMQGDSLETVLGHQ